MGGLVCGEVGPVWKLDMVLETEMDLAEVFKHEIGVFRNLVDSERTRQMEKLLGPARLVGRGHLNILVSKINGNTALEVSAVLTIDISF